MLRVLIWPLCCAPQLHLDGYQAFLEHMCPGTALAGQVPPPGTDPSACPKPIMGVYDDHDFGWNNGNRRCVTVCVHTAKHLPPYP